MDGTLMKELHGNLNQLSEESMKKLLKYYGTGILTSKDLDFVQNDLIKPEDMLKEHHSPN
tara:strand:- start:18 stop:197 length:180 start_codon:yes stop_codon:yes gene_type:complete